MMSNRGCVPSKAQRFGAFLLGVPWFLISCGGGSTTSAPPPPTLQSITVSPGNTTVAAGLTQQYVATGNYSDGGSQPLNAVTWTTSDSTLATVTSTGLVTTLKQGHLTVSVASGTIAGNTGLTVGPPVLQSLSLSPKNTTVAAGLTQQFTATGAFSDGTSNAVTTVTWSVSDATLAAVNSAGLVTTFKQGQLAVSATSGMIVGNTGLTVGPAVLQSLGVSPQNATVAAGLTQQFTATGGFSDGTSKTVSTVTWSVSDQTLATVDSAGLVTTHRQGAVIITAASGSISNTAPLSVGPPVPAALNIVPANDKVLIGAAAPTKLSAILTYSDGSTADVSTAAAWSVTNSFVASIDNSGNVTTVRTGYTGVSATNGSFTANTSFTVIAEPRYLYFGSASGLLASKAIIDANSGQPYMAAYIPSGVTNSTVSPCPTTDPLNQFLYVGAYVSASPVTAGEIQIYRIDPISGALSPVTGNPFSSSPVTCIDFEPTGKFGFATIGVNSATFLATYSRDTSTGDLTLANSANLQAVPTRAAIDPLGQYLYVGVSTDGFNTTSGIGFSINLSTGALTTVPGSPFKLSNLGGTFTFHPTGNFLFMANSNGQSIDTYSVARATGALTFTSSIATCVNPTPVRFSPDGAFAYTTCSMDANHNVNPSLESFAVAPNGALTHLGSTSSLVLAADITVDPSGQFLYMSTIQPYVLAAAIGANGVAGPVRRVGTQGNPSTSNVVVGGPTAVTHTQKFAYITSTADNTMSAYGVNADGTLTVLQSPVATSASPFSLSLWPWGTDLVLATEGASPAIDFFSLSPTTGILTSGGSITNAATSGGAAIDPSGQFAFQTDAASGVVDAYEKTNVGTWGHVTTTFAAGAGAGPIVIDPSGFLVYVANQAANSISVYQYPGTSPQLIQATGSPFSIGAKPLLMAIDPNESFLYVVCGDQMLRVFTIDYFSGGVIAQVASVPLAGQPSGLTAEPKGRFVYTSDSIGVSAFAVNAQTGGLTAVPLSPAITLSNTTGVYAEPAGQYLYITTGAQNVQGAVYGFSILSDGTLTAISSSALATPKLPSSMVFSDSIQ